MSDPQPPSRVAADRLWMGAAGLGGFLAVAAGAYGAHAGLDSHAVSLFDKATRYQSIHAVALLALAVAGGGGGGWRHMAGAAFLAGMVLFCGSLYALALTGRAEFAVITPVGGVAFLAGWLFVLAAALFGGKHQSPPPGA